MIHLNIVPAVEERSTSIYRYNACNDGQEIRYERLRCVVAKKIK
jgi:hypothetical protein